MPDYPDTFTAPDHSSYSGFFDAGLLRTATPFPDPSQRKVFNSGVEEINLTFSMTPTDFSAWYAWCKDNAYDFFDMNLITSRVPDYIVSKVRTRFVSDISLSYIGHDWLRTSVTAELVPGDTSQNGATRLYQDFVLAGTPASPSIDFVLAGTPDAPATDMIYGELYEFTYLRQ